MTTPTSPRADTLLLPEVRAAVKKAIDNWICAELGEGYQVNLPHIAADLELALILLSAPPAGMVLVPEEPTEEWLPMSSAPKDGAEFLGYSWSDYRQKGFTSIASWAEAAGCFIDETGDTADRLTHWRPLPAPPAAIRNRGATQGYGE